MPQLGKDGEWAQTMRVPELQQVVLFIRKVKVPASAVIVLPVSAPLARVWVLVKLFAAARVGTLVVSSLRVVAPPRATRPPPVRSVPAVTVSEECARSVLVTPPAARLMVPVLVIVPPAKPAPAVTLVTEPTPGNVCPVAKVTRPLELNFSPVSEGAVAPSPNSRFNVPEGAVVSLPAGSACKWKT